ncbi:2-phospho-L-lactate guanylyltransferase [Lacisediminihabitans profunda]|uniref:2-phospho-L-lactate guanylyltransferase n=1 Tax=Lacisediminihabitans profunda TaxID=2594790 RepID=UPI001C9C9BC5|nr:2-phospho-L-lactate guanylyltransferase [Lacisediminihabitans profunda]
MTDWWVVVPVKGTADAKSRFGGSPGAHASLARAIALDTVEAALATPGVLGVLVVTSSEASADFAGIGATVVVEAGPPGLTSAIAQGIERATARSAMGEGVAILLGDLPALSAEELGQALGLAAAHPRAMVADADGTGTTLITALSPATHAPAFGIGSAAAHAAAGYVVLPVSAASGLRRDVDTLEELRELAGRLGVRTAAAFRGL